MVKECPVFGPHALLLRGTFYVLWRDNTRALMDLDAVISTPGVSKKVTMKSGHVLFIFFLLSSCLPIFVILRSPSLSSMHWSRKPPFMLAFLKCLKWRNALTIASIWIMPAQMPFSTDLGWEDDAFFKYYCLCLHYTYYSAWFILFLKGTANDIATVLGVCTGLLHKIQSTHT